MHVSEPCAMLVARIQAVGCSRQGPGSWRALELGTAAGGSLMHCRILSGTPGLHPLDANSTPPMSRDNRRWFQTWPNIPWRTGLPQ